ncbi:TadE/TadG family type IV pilus assembly protein [Bradyrhizobium prioriisuperbiae]|uniref:TadE/TadG family type IV pilus assembly protein n=1 Tax=Bradyrhizobium prioriisuperbiae TaxID=2854389 RepID=UPI0028E4FF64|nr:pilus assembly protein TadG-related protein [Bradyrhizobium prioritasuperba]
MTALLNMTGVKRQIARFVRTDDGSILPMFGFTLLMLLSMVGAAVDYARVYNARTAMQAAIDSAALMISKDASAANPPMTQADIQTKAEGYFNTLYTNSYTPKTGFKATYTPPSSGSPGTIKLEASGTMPTELLRVAGITKIDFSISSTATWGNSRLRVALALDNTGSMKDNGKIGALQKATNDLITKLSQLSTVDGDVLISIVPFAKDINADPTNYNQAWIDWTDWEAEPPVLVTSKPAYWSSYGPGSSCPFTNQQGFGCIAGPANYTTAYTIPSSGLICPGQDGTYASYYNGCYNSVGTTTSTTNQVCSGNSCSCGSRSNCSCSGTGKNTVCSQVVTTTGAPYTHTWIPNDHSTWNGCITDRTQPNDVKNVAATSTATNFPAQQYNACPTSVMGMSSDWATLKKKVGLMTPNGGTNQPVGMAWAWQSLSSEGSAQSQPIKAPAEESNYIYKKIIILLSDGLNTQDRWPAYGNGSKQVDGQIDARQKLLCTNAKVEATVYTIQVNVGSVDPQSAVLQGCASDTSKFYMLTDPDQIITTFNSILIDISKLRIAY